MKKTEVRKNCFTSLLSQLFGILNRSGGLTNVDILLTVIRFFGIFDRGLNQVTKPIHNLMNISAKKRHLRGILLIAGLIFIIPSVQAQKDYDLLGKGARAAGMAYAFNAIADDAMAMSWNPSGMVQIKKPEVAFVNSLTATKYKHILYSRNIYNPQYSIDYAGIVYPLKIKMRDLVFGVSYQNKINCKSAYSTGNDTSAGYSNYKNKVTVNSFSVSGAFSITRFLGIGITYNQWFSLGNEADGYDYTNTRDWDNKVAYPYDLNTIETAETFKYKGSNFNAGILLDFSTFHLPLRFALKYESKFVLKNDYYARFKLDFQYKNSIDTTYLETFDGIEKFHFPGIMAMGISYRIGDYLTIACDYDIKPFKNKDYIINYTFYKSLITTHTDTMDYGPYEDKFKLLECNDNLHQFRIGAEYIIHPRFALIPVRAGWKNNPTRLSDQVSHEQVYAHSLNFGTGLIIQHLSIDLAYERYLFNRNIVILEQNYFEEKIFHFFTLSMILSL